MAYIEINTINYQHNINFLAKKAGGIDKLMVVLKDNAYGHDLKIMAHLAASFGVKKSAVKNLKEAEQIISLFEEILILVDHPPLQRVAKNISFAVHSLEGLKKFPNKSAVHVNIDTGMHRNGIQEEELEEAIVIIKENNLILKGFFTHFKNADEVGTEQFWQESNFISASARAKELILKHQLPMPAFHSCNSASLLRRKEILQDDYARCGISTYGYSHLDKSFGVFDLKPVLSLWAERLSSRNLKKGDRVGYGGLYELETDGVVSTYDIGYGDGFFRYNGRGHLVLDSGMEILGRVSMDSFAMAGEAKSVCLFKDAHSIASYFNTITYDVMTKLSPSIKKVIV
jgi:alanine racemase